MTTHPASKVPRASQKLLTRDEYREGVFARDRHRCVVCSASRGRAEQTAGSTHAVRAKTPGHWEQALGGFRAPGSVLDHSFVKNA